MKLEQKFAEILTFTEIEGCYEQCIDCVKISEEFAIDFLDWIFSKDVTIIKDKNIYTRKELLEIYKNENSKT